MELCPGGRLEVWLRQFPHTARKAVLQLLEASMKHETENLATVSDTSMLVLWDMQSIVHSLNLAFD